MTARRAVWLTAGLYAAALAALVLHVVVPTAVGLPDIDLDASNGLALGVSDGADREHGLTLRVAGHFRAILQRGRIVRVEGTQKRTFGGVGRLRVVYTVDQE